MNDPKNNPIHFTRPSDHAHADQIAFWQIQKPRFGFI